MIINGYRGPTPNEANEVDPIFVTARNLEKLGREMSEGTHV